MKYKLVGLLLLLFLFSCTRKIFPVTGSYPTQPIEITTNKTFDKVWDNLIDLFAQNGLSIKIIDRSSGLIISDKSKIPVTIEENDGTLRNPKAYVVVPKFKDYNANRMVPITGYHFDAITKKLEFNTIEGEWNVRIKKTETGCIINVNITNMYYTNTSIVNYRKNDQLVALSTAKTTGVFEQFITDLIK